MLGLGASLNGSLIKEGDDVYFECRVRYQHHFCLLENQVAQKFIFSSIRANPRAYKISWRCNVSHLLVNLFYTKHFASRKCVVSVSKINAFQWRKCTKTTVRMIIYSLHLLQVFQNCENALANAKMRKK